MPIEIKTPKAVRGSTYDIAVTFADAAGAAVTPSSAQWSLSDEAGTIINERQNVAIDSPSSAETIVLSGNDLSLTYDCDLLLTVEAVYSSDEGDNLPLREQIKFPYRTTARPPDDPAT